MKRDRAQEEEGAPLKQRQLPRSSLCGTLAASVPRTCSIEALRFHPETSCPRLPVGAHCCWSSGPRRARCVSKSCACRWLHPRRPPGSSPYPSSRFISQRPTSTVLDKMHRMPHMSVSCFRGPGSTCLLSTPLPTISVQVSPLKSPNQPTGFMEL